MLQSYLQIITVQTRTQNGSGRWPWWRFCHWTPLLSLSTGRGGHWSWNVSGPAAVQYTPTFYTILNQPFLDKSKSKHLDNSEITAASWMSWAAFKWHLISSCQKTTDTLIFVLRFDRHTAYTRITHCQITVNIYCGGTQAKQHDGIT